MKALFFTIGLFFSVIESNAQQKITENTLKYDSAIGSPTTDISMVAWILGHWKGPALGGEAEEMWTKPTVGSMIGSFKHSVNNEVNFYEIQTISEIDSTLIMRLKHFDPELKGWEEKDETVNFELVKVEENKVFFDGLTFEKINDDQMNVYVVMKSKGKLSELKFPYERVK